MSLEFIDELEKKIDEMVDSLKTTRHENIEKSSKVEELIDENETLKLELDESNTELTNYKSQLDTAVDKIKNLLNKLENVE